MTSPLQIHREFDSLGISGEPRKQALRFALRCLLNERIRLLDEIDNLINVMADELCPPEPNPSDLEAGYEAMKNEHLDQRPAKTSHADDIGPA